MGVNQHNAGLQVMRVESKQAVQNPGRFGKSPLAYEKLSIIEEGRRVLWIKGQACLVAANGSIQIIPRSIEQGQVKVRPGVSWIDSDGSLKGRDGSIGTVQMQPCHSEIGMGQSVAGIERDQSIGFGHGF
jgi:hypothetical protein